MASKFSSLTATRGKGILFRATTASVLFETAGNPLAPSVTTLTASADSISTLLDTDAGVGAVGFKVFAGDTLDLGAGGDSLSVLGAGPTGSGDAINATGIQIGAGGKLDLGLGNDSILVGLVGAGSVGIENNGTLLTGAGIDKIGTDAAKNGLVNAGELNTGSGADRLDATSSDGAAGSHAIYNTGTITMGTNDEADKDVLTGGSLGHGVLTAAYTPDHAGIYNSGTINMGGGKDVIDALVGGFAGGGTYNLGGTNGRGQLDTDADAVFGFGWGTFNGGGGRNSITLPGGTYHIAYTTKPVSLRDLASGTITRSNTAGGPLDLNAGTTDVTTMTFNGFDGIGGFDALLGALHFVDVPAGGVARVLTDFTVNATTGIVENATYV